VGKSLRAAFVLVVACGLLLGMMSTGAFGAVTLTHELNWGSEGWGPGQFKYPFDVTVDKFGSVYVAGGEDGDNRIQMFDSSGVFVRSVGTSAEGDPGSSLLSLPDAVAIDRWRNVYVAEEGNGGRIHIFLPELYNGSDISYSTLWDGVDESNVANPNSIAVGLNGRVYVNIGANAIQRWSTSGEYIGTLVPGGMPTGVGVSQDDVLYMTTREVGTVNKSLVMRFDVDGAPLGSWGGFGTDPGYMRDPYDVGTDGAGTVFVVEAGGHRGQVFTASGTYLAQFGSVGSGSEQFVGPYGIGVGFDRTVYVADTFNHRISKWTVNEPTTYAPIAGDNRYETAVEASKKAYPDGARSVVLATGANWPDALGGAALAGMSDGPLLLTAKDYLPVSVAAEIDRLGAQHVYVLGSDAAVSDDVADAAAAIVGMPCTRLGGDDRYETANLIAEEAIFLDNTNGDGYDGTAFVCTGADFPDALAAAPIAAANGWPIYLTKPDGLPASARTAMLDNGSIHGYVIGSTNAVSATVATQLEDMSPLSVQAFGRIGGANRYETAAKVAEDGFNGMGMLWSRPALAIGTNFPDALAGGVLQGSDYSLLLLTRGDSLSAEAAAKLTQHKDEIYELRYLGGTNVLKPAVRTAAKARLW